jgi:hypothetical protein
MNSCHKDIFFPKIEHFDNYMENNLEIEEIGDARWRVVVDYGDSKINGVLNAKCKPIVGLEGCFGQGNFVGMLSRFSTILNKQISIFYKTVEHDSIKKLDCDKVLVP